MLSVSNLSVQFGKRVLFDEVNTTFNNGNCYGIIGANGAGKSTLLKTLIGELAPLEGESKLGAQVQIGYFAQAHEGLDPRKTIIDVVMEAGDMGSPTSVRKVVAICCNTASPAK